MPVPRFHPPQQLRSQETLDRILDAAEAVIEGKSFSDATLAEIMDRAGVTVGAFYRRFPDKDALLQHMDQRFFDEVHGRGDALLDPARWEGASAADIVAAFAREAVAIYRERRGLLRSLFLRARTDPVLQQSAARVNAHLLQRLRRVLLPRAAEMAHPDPARAIDLAYMLLVGALRETTLFDEGWPRPSPAHGADLADELARMLQGYLGVRAGKATSGEKR